VKAQIVSSVCHLGLDSNTLDETCGKVLHLDGVILLSLTRVCVLKIKLGSSDFANT